MLVTMVQKVALDQTAKSYWEEYYGEYGKLWVRDIPMKIKAALKSDTRTAGLENVEVAPLGKAITADRVILDGVARDATTRTATLFRAEFTHEGELVAIDTIAAPAV